VSDVAPGHRHDLIVARDTDLIGVLNWAASALDLSTLADAGYDGAGQGIKHRSSSPPAARFSLRTTRPTTPCTGPPAAAGNAGSPCSPAAGEHFDGSPSARTQGPGKVAITQR
jgi:hypothetical protein